jgi:DNA repair exonuclease SbcCD nuclease subunit
MNALKEWENTFIIDKPKIIEINKLKFVTIPYVPPGRFVEALNTLDSDWKNVDCIFAHQEFFGCKMGAVESTEGDKWDLMFPFVVSGHIHSEQRPQENIFYPGSVIQHAFGESEDNGILLLTFTTASTGKIEQKMEKIILDIPRMKTVTVKILDFAKLQIAPKKNERLKIICKGSVEEFKSLKKTKLFKKLAMDNSVKIQFKFVQKEGEKGRIKSEFTTFSKILERLILNENNALLTDSYRQLILP